MTEGELAAIIAGIAPIVRELRDRATQRGDALAIEVSTLREAVLTQVRTLETRNVKLEARCARLETKLLKLEAKAAAVRS